MWFAAAAVLVGLGLVLLSLSMTLGRREPGEGENEGPDRGTAEAGAGQALFIDEPLATDLAAALAGKTPRPEAKASEVLAPAINGADGDRPDEALAVAPVPREAAADGELPAGPADGDGDISREDAIPEDDDTLEAEAPEVSRKLRRRVVSHSGRKPGAKPDKPKKSRSKPGLFPRGR
jgi:hypothetical protein